MGEFQLWLENTLASAQPVAAMMRTTWGWPITESVHFIGLTLLFGSIGAWDLRLLGVAERVPIAEFHRLVPLAIVGFCINAASGSLFLMTEPNQYLYNPAFHFKVLFLALAGLNVLIFYATTFRRTTQSSAGSGTPHSARVAGAVSLICWIAVITCGRLITFYRPFECGPEEATAFLLQCLK
jgi:hypothetical protein